MRRSLYGKKLKCGGSQIVGIVKDVELGAKVGETCRSKASAGPLILQVEESVQRHDGVALGPDA